MDGRWSVDGLRDHCGHCEYYKRYFRRNNGNESGGRHDGDGRYIRGDGGTIRFKRGVGGVSYYLDHSRHCGHYRYLAGGMQCNRKDDRSG